MIAFQVQDMTCGHCASTITKALKSVDPGAKVMIDLAKHLVMVGVIVSFPQIDTVAAGRAVAARCGARAGRDSGRA